MTDGIPVFGPVSVNTGEALDLAKSGLVKGSPYLAAGIALANADEIAEILDDFLADAARTLTATSQEQFCGALRAWGDALVHLATVILSPVVSTGADSSFVWSALVSDAYPDVSRTRSRPRRIASSLNMLIAAFLTSRFFAAEAVSWAARVVTPPSVLVRREVNP